MGAWPCNSKSFEGERWITYINISVRQKTMSKKYNYKDDFEMIYLRHEYITEDKNMNNEHVKKYEHIIKNTARIMYDKLYPNFNKVSFDLDDLIAITSVYLLGYMNNYSIYDNKKEATKWINAFKQRMNREPIEEEKERSERNRIINFLRQRIQHCSLVCARKARNITVGKDRRRYFAETANSRHAAEEDIIDNYKKYGYRLITIKEFKSAKKKAKEKGQKEFFDKDGYRIFQIELLNNGIVKDDYVSLFNDSSFRSYHRSPEEELHCRQRDIELEKNRVRFNKLSDKNKRQYLTSFIENNKSNKHLKVELKTARKILKNIKENGIIGSGQ